MIRHGLVRKLGEMPADASQAVRTTLGQRTITLVGLMGCGKSSIGRRLAQRLELTFVDADDEIERAAGKTINDIFADHGEQLFRDGERKVIARLLAGGPQVLATGGGAYMNAETRRNIHRAGTSVWLRAELPILLRRVLKRDNRPLLKGGDPETVLRRLMAVRYPIYAEADLVMESRDVPHEVIVDEILASLSAKPHLLERGAG